MIFNYFVKAILKSPFHRMLSKGTILLSFNGKKSGKRYDVPVNFVWDNEDYLVTSLRSRIWWKNLRGKSICQLLDAGNEFDCVADVLEDYEEVARSLKTYLELAPKAAKYFSVSLNEEGHLNEDDLRLAANERVILRISKRA